MCQLYQGWHTTPSWTKKPYRASRRAHCEQVMVLDFWVKRIKETGMLMMEQPKLGIILEERVVEPSVPELEGQVSFDMVLGTVP